MTIRDVFSYGTDVPYHHHKSHHFSCYTLGEIDDRLTMTYGIVARTFNLFYKAAVSVYQPITARFMAFERRFELAAGLRVG
jgi:hypothetical protein